LILRVFIPRGDASESDSPSSLSPRLARATFRQAFAADVEAVSPAM
jgi:hypothetical protein